MANKNTTIKLMTNDQSLLVVEKPTIAAGDKNSVRVKVAFDNMWAAYVNRSAVFYTSTDSTVYEMLLTDSSCPVPGEVLAEPCTLFIGIRGITADGMGVKTSTLVKCKIHEGAVISRETAEPSPDLYQQYLAQLNAAANPVIDELKAENEAALEEKKAEIDESVDAKLTAFEASFTKARMACDEYTGDGTFGEANKTSIDFGFVPAFVYVTRNDDDQMQGEDTFHAINGQVRSYPGAEINFEWEGTVVRWYAASASSQCNENTVKYRWFAIGLAE